MSKWDDRVETHAVHAAFDNVLAVLSGLSKERIELAPEDVARLIWVVNHVRVRLKHTPAMAVPAATLDQLNTQASQISGEVTSFAGNGNVAHLSNAMSAADAMLEQARVLTHLAGDAAVGEADSYLQRVQVLLATVVSGADAAVSAVQGSAATAQQEIGASRDQLSAQLTAATQKAAEVETNVGQQVARLEQALTGHETQFAQAEKTRADEFEAAEHERASAAEATVKRASDQFTVTAGKLEDDAAGTLQALAELKKQADELLGAIGVEGVASGYNETAKKEKEVADNWRWGTVAVAIVAAGILASALLVDHSAAGSWQRIVTRLVVSLSLAGLAAYCGRQSAEHRQIERDARSRQLQLAALNPYLANMDPMQSMQLKAELAPGYFTPVVPVARDGKEGDDAGSVSLDQFLEAMRLLATKGMAN